MITSYRHFKAALIYLALGFIVVSSVKGIISTAAPTYLQFDDRDMPPRLIGTGCKGANGPLWADEEDEFPLPCADIHVIPLYEGG